MKFFFLDEDNDVLYVTFAHPNAGIRYMQTERGDVLRFCTETNQIVGVTVLFFAARSARGEAIDIAEVGMVSFASALTAPPATGISHGKATH